MEKIFSRLLVLNSLTPLYKVANVQQMEHIFVRRFTGRASQIQKNLKNKCLCQFFISVFSGVSVNKSRDILLTNSDSSPIIIRGVRGLLEHRFTEIANLYVQLTVIIAVII